MKRFWGYFALLISVSLCSVHADAAGVDAFARVPVSSPFYTQLETVKGATWELDADGPQNSNKSNRYHAKTGEKELTRYEFSVELAKIAIDFDAHRSADKEWLNTVPRSELRALRGLLSEFNTELSNFDINAEVIIRSIDTVLRSPAIDQNRSSKAPTPEISLKLGRNANNATPFIGGFPLLSSLDVRNEKTPDVSMSLSDKLRLFGNLSTVPLPQKNIAPAVSDSASANSAVSQNAAVNAGADLSISHWLSLRADYAFGERSRPLTLRQTLSANQQYLNAWFPEMGTASSFGGGVNVKVAPSLTLSGGVSRLSLGRYGQENDFSGTQLEGGVGVSGLSNRLSLSASVARLMPDDATALDSTAARLNLDFAISNNLSLNLLYQQMFSLSPQSDTKSTFAGGVNIHF